MAQQQNSHLGELYSHMSRLYNSSVSVLIAIVFGWAAFLGVYLNLTLSKEVPSDQVLFFFLPMSIIIGIVAAYNFVRVLYFGRWIFQLETDLGLRGKGAYIETHQIWPTTMGWLTSREIRWISPFSAAEVISIAVLGVYFVSTFCLVFLMPS